MGIRDGSHGGTAGNLPGPQAVFQSGLGDSAAVDISRVIVRSGNSSHAAIERDRMMTVGLLVPTLSAAWWPWKHRDWRASWAEVSPVLWCITVTWMGRPLARQHVKLGGGKLESTRRCDRAPKANEALLPLRLPGPSMGGSRLLKRPCQRCDVMPLGVRLVLVAEEPMPGRLALVAREPGRQVTTAGAG